MITDDDFRDLLATSDRMVGAVSTERHRYLYDRIDWRDRLICIKGARGTGKTTILLQRLREAFGPGSGKALYASLDDLWFATRSLKDLAVHLDSHGFTHLFLDEVHHLPAWRAQLKNLTDQFPALSVVYSGSSLLDLEKGEADLSRRQVVHTLECLSFREFLGFEGALDLDPVPLSDLLRHHRAIAADATAKVKILPLFERYLRQGCYPFYKTAFAGYHARIAAIVNKVLDVDWPAAEHVTVETIRRAKRMLAVLAASVPQQPNMAALYRQLGTERNQGSKMLRALERARLLALLASRKPTLKDLSAPDKIYCGDPNLMVALAPRSEAGAIRETFFMNQVRKDHALLYPAAGDFLVDGTHLFEVGGPGKGFKQIRDVPDSYVAADGIEIGYGNKIPLWMFGLLY